VLKYAPPVAREYKDKSVLSTVLGSKALCMLAAPSTPNDVRAEVERRAIEGESIYPVTVTGYDRNCVRNGVEYQIDTSGITAEAERRVAAAKAKAQ